MVHTDAQLLNFDKDPGSAVVLFRIMAGVPHNHLSKPFIPHLPVSIQGIIDEFAGNAGYNASIGVCGVFGTRKIMTYIEAN